MKIIEALRKKCPYINANCYAPACMAWVSLESQGREDEGYCANIHTPVVLPMLDGGVKHVR